MSSDEKFLDKLEENGGLTKSQKARLSLQEEAQESLVGFLKKVIENISDKSELKTLVEDRIKKELENKESVVGFKSLVDLLNVLETSNNQATANIFGVLKESTKVSIENNIPQNQGNSGSIIDANQYKKISRLNGLLEKLEESEFNEEEIEIKDFVKSIKEK